MIFANMIEPAELIVGAFLQHVFGCEIIQYNVRLAGGGLPGLSEFDVLGINLQQRKAWLCEVATHLGGLNYGKGNQDTVSKIQKKLQSQRTYAATTLGEFGVTHMFWSPVVPEGQLTSELRAINDIDLRINGEFKSAVGQLRNLARESAHDMKNVFMRFLQIMERLKDG